MTTSAPSTTPAAPAEEDYANRRVGGGWKWDTKIRLYLTVLLAFKYIYIWPKKCQDHDLGQGNFYGCSPSTSSATTAALKFPTHLQPPYIIHFFFPFRCARYMPKVGGPNKKSKKEQVHFVSYYIGITFLVEQGAVPKFKRRVIPLTPPCTYECLSPTSSLDLPNNWFQFRIISQNGDEERRKEGRKLSSQLGSHFVCGMKEV